MGDLPAKIRKRVEAIHGTVGDPRHKAAQAAENARQSACMDALKVAKRKLPRPEPVGVARFKQQVRAERSGLAFTMETEHRFHGKRKWRFDFAWPHSRIAVEIEGVTYDGGRHQRPKGYTEDCRKYNAAQLAGWMVLRFTPTQVRKGEVIPALDAAFAWREMERRRAEDREREIRHRAIGMADIVSGRPNARAPR